VRVVIDTNVLLAAVATHGLCEALVTLIFRDHTVIVSEHILGEFAEHYQGKFKATREQAEAAVDVLRSGSDLVTPAAVPRDVLLDLDDLPVLGTAVAGSADCIVTGDRELLALKRFETIPLLSPRDFYEQLPR